MRTKILDTKTVNHRTLQHGTERVTLKHRNRTSEHKTYNIKTIIIPT